jgi:deoxyribonuclease IV
MPHRYGLTIKHAPAEVVIKNLEEGVKAGITVFQIVNGSPNEFSERFTFKELKKIASTIKKHKLTISVHAKFTINTCKSNRHVIRKIIIDELNAAMIIGAKYVVIHVGNYAGEKNGKNAYETCFKAMVSNIQFALKEFGHKENSPTLLIETPANGNVEICSTFEELAKLVKQIELGIKGKFKLGVCMDTAHIYNSGYDLRAAGTMTLIVKHFKELFGSKFKLIHLNDTPRKCGENGQDRHLALKEGEIFTDSNLELFLELTKGVDTVIEH